MYKRQGYEEPDEMEYSLATLMMNIVNDEKLNIEKTIQMCIRDRSMILKKEVQISMSIHLPFVQ